MFDLLYILRPPATADQGLNSDQLATVQNRSTRRRGACVCGNDATRRRDLAWLPTQEGMNFFECEFELVWQCICLRLGLVLSLARLQSTTKLFLLLRFPPHRPPPPRPDVRRPSRAHVVVIRMLVLVFVLELAVFVVFAI